MISDARVKALAEWREKEDELREKESIKRARAIIKGQKIQESIEKRGLVIRPEEVKQCCGNIPSIGATKDSSFVYCCWCKKEVKTKSAIETIKEWNKL